MSAPPVLVIEDDPMIARALKRALRSHSLEVAVAHTVGDALKDSHRYPVAIVDVHLPDGNGIDLFRQLKAEGRILKSVFFTATENQSEREDAAASGTFVSKSEGVEKAVSVAVDLVRSATH